MAYRVVVDKPRQIRALASRAKVTVADINLKKSQALVTRTSYAAAISSQVLNAFASYAQPTTEIYYQNLNAIDVVLDPYSLNKYFRLEEFGISDAASLIVGKQADETIGTSDQIQNLVIGKSATDILNIGDYVHVLLEIMRSFEDSLSTNDTQVLGVDLSKSDAFSTADLTDIYLSKSLTDSLNSTDLTSLVLGKSFAETAAVTDSFAKTATFARSFADAFTLDDFTDVNAIRKDSTAAKNNVVGFSDTQSFGTEKDIQDSATITEVAALLTQRPATDSFSVTEAFQKVTTFSRAFAETATPSDTSTTSFEKGLSDTATVSDTFQKNVAFSRTFSDSVSFAEQSVAAFEKGLSDTTSVTEAIEITTMSLASSVLNAGALNSSPLNN